jgi:hypothetical protein
MREAESTDTKLACGSPSRSALDDGMDRVCEKLDEEKAASVKLSTKQRLPKVVRRRFIPLKGENPSAAPLSSHFPWIKEHARPLSKPLR